MLWNATAIKGYVIDAADGEIGTVADLLFEDGSWAIRWLIVETGTWLSAAKVLLPAAVLGEPHAEPEHVHVRLTRQQVRDAPAFDPDTQLTREIEATHARYYAISPYWDDDLMQGFYARQAADSDATKGATTVMDRRDARNFDRAPGPPHIHSVMATQGLTVEGTDDAIGHVEDLLVDTGGWTARYITVHTGVWWPGEKVLISPLSVEWIDWIRRDIQLDISRQQVLDSPPYKPEMTVDGAYDESFLTYYGIRWVKK